MSLCLTVSEVAWLTAFAVLVAAAWRAWLLSPKGYPTNWPVLGMLPGLTCNLHHFYDWITQLLIANGNSFQFYGPWLTSMNYFITSDPRNVEHALRDNFQDFPKGKDFSDIFHDLLGDGIFNADDELWRSQRKIASLHLNSRAFKRFSDRTVFSAVEEKLLPILRDVCSKGSPLDLQMILLRFTFDTICIVAFGVDAGCLSGQLDTDLGPFAVAFEAALECTTMRFFLPPSWWRASRVLGCGKERGMPQALAVVRRFAEDVIAARRKELSLGESRNDLLSCFMRVQGVDSSDNDKFLRDVAINFLLAGRDTSALALSWFFWLVTTHPEVERRLVEEVQREMSDGSGFSRDKLSRMTYLHAALSEALRLYPSVPVEVKHVMKDGILPDGNHVKKDHKFVFSLYTMGRMESIWGADCTSFRPERWLSEKGMTPVSPFQYAVFNAGPRTCLGKDMAYLLMKAVASVLLFHFRISLIPEHKVVPKLSITLYMKNGLLVSLQPREA